MSKPQVILLTDDPATADVMRLLLCDWGYAAITRQLSARAARPPDATAVAIICDVVHADAEAGLAAALALRGVLRPDIPVLISAQDTCPILREPAPPLVKVWPKPMHPHRLRLWIDAQGFGGGPIA